MKFFFDHDVAEEFRFPLEALGHEVVRLREVLQRDTTDADILAHTARAGQAGQAGQVLVTLQSCRTKNHLASPKSEPLPLNL